MAQKLYDPVRTGRPMRVAAFMSGSGSNVVQLLERGSGHYEIVFIFSDRTDGKCRGEAIAHKYGLPYFAYDIRRFHEIGGLSRSVATEQGMAARKIYDRVAAQLTEAFRVDVLALGGYMSFLTLPGAVNVHPADLSIIDDRGMRVFVGDNAVYDAICAGQTELRSSTLWTDLGVDSGPLLMVSDPVPVELPAPLSELRREPGRLAPICDEHQERLKEKGDWVIFPLTLDLMGQGRLGITDQGVAVLDGIEYPKGIRMSDI